MRNVNADCLIHAGRQLIAVLSGKHLGIHNDTVFAVRHFQGGISHLSCFFTEDGTQQPLLRGKLGLALRRHLTYQNIACTHLCADADDTSIVQILKRIVTDTGNIPGDFFGSKFGITRLRFIFFHVHGRVNILLHQSFT